MNDLTFGRPFVLKRDRDISEVSGTGIIADGIVFPDGHAAIHWRGKWPLTTPHPDGLESILAIHDHGGQGDLHVVWPDQDETRKKVLADVAEAYDVPAYMLGTRAERAYLHRQITRALTAEHLRRAAEQTVASPEEHCTGFAKAVMPIVAPLQEQRDQAMRANGRAYGLARTWRHAHGASQFLVRSAGAELLDVLDEDDEPGHDWHHPTPLSGLVCRRCDLAHKFWSGEACIADDHDEVLAAVECSAQFYKANSGPAHQCIRAAQHRGAHIDEHGFHWSDTVAVYPVDDDEDDCTIPLVPPILMEAIRKDEAARTQLADAVLADIEDHVGDVRQHYAGPDAQPCTKHRGRAERQRYGCNGPDPAEQGPPNQGPLTGIEVRDPCPYCEDCRLIPRTLIADHIREQHPDITVASHENGSAAATEATEAAEPDAHRAETAERQRDQYAVLLRVVLSLDADLLPSYRVAQIRAALDQAKEA